MANLIETLSDPKNLPTLLLVVIDTLFVLFLTRVIWRQYCALLQAEPGGRNWTSLSRLRALHEKGGTWAQWYHRYLRRLLGALDRFLGDAPDAERSLFPRFFGLLHEKAPLWTARGYDRCLLLALISPVLSTILCWAAWNTQGAAEPALGLGSASLPARLALLAVLAAAMLGILARTWTRTTSRFDGTTWRYPVSAFVVVIVIAISIGGVVAGALVAAIGGAVFYARSGPVAIPSAFAFACAAAGLSLGVTAVSGAGSALFSFPAAFTGGNAGALALAGIAGIGPVLAAQFTARKPGREEVFLACFTVGLTCLVFALPTRLVHWAGVAWHNSGALLLFFGLLPLLTAPFDWISFGITRGLFRLALQIKAGPMPYLLSLIGVAASLIGLFLLIPVLVLGIRLFNVATQIGGGKIILDLHDTLARLQHRADPENVWIYLTLLITLLPGLVNVTMAIASLASRMMPLRRYILRRIDFTNGVGEYRPMVAAALTFPWLLALIVTPILCVTTVRLLYGEGGLLGNAMLAWARLLAGNEN